MFREIIVPLHNLSCCEKLGCEITTNYIWLNKFTYNEQVYHFDEHRENCGMFSEYDFESLRKATWALYIRITEPLEQYKVDANLFVLALSLTKPSNVYIQHHLDPHIYHHRNLRESMPMSFWFEFSRYVVYKKHDITKARIIYKRLREMYDASWYSKRSLWFLYQQTTTHQWVAKYILLSCSLEHLFGIEHESDSSIKVCKRVKSYINIENLENVRSWYRTRSDLVHGRYRGELENADYNVVRTKQLEGWIRKVFMKMLTRKDYLWYSCKSDRHAFLDIVEEYCPIDIGH